MEGNDFFRAVIGFGGFRWMTPLQVCVEDAQDALRAITTQLHGVPGKNGWIEYTIDGGESWNTWK